MTALSLAQQTDGATPVRVARAPDAVGPVPEADAAALDRVRRIARCSRLWAANTLCRDSLADLVKALPEALGRAPRFFAPGTASLSFDEAWLLALKEAVARSDTDSYTFLLQTRMSRERASSLHFVLCPALATLGNAAG